MKEITKEEFERAIDLYFDATTQVIDKDNNILHLYAAYAQYYAYIMIGKNEKYYELTFEEFNKTERELIHEKIFRISEKEFKDVQGFRDKPPVFEITFSVENDEKFYCKISFYYNENGIFADAYDGPVGYAKMYGYFKISDNINQFSTDEIVNRFKKYFPDYNFKQEINVNKM